jgi:PAS domain S-box-containing protein
VLSLLVIAFRLGSINERAQRSSNALLRDDTTRSLEVSVDAYVRAVTEFGSGGDASFRAAAETQAQRISDGVGTYRRLLESPQQESYLQSFAGDWQQLEQQGQAVLLGETTTQASGQALQRISELEARLQRILLVRMQPDSSAAFAQVRGRALGQLQGLFRYVLLVLGLGAIIAIVTSIVVSRSVLREEHLISEQSDLMRATLSSIGDAVITTDLDGRVTHLNRVAEMLTGRTQADAIGEKLTAVFRILDEGTRQPIEDPAARALRGGRPVDIVNHTLLIAEDGSECPIEERASPIRSGDGRIHGSILVFRDIRERREKERELSRGRAAKARLAALVESSDDAIVSKSLDGIIDSWNRGAQRLFGYAPEEAIGRPITMLIPPERMGEEQVILRRIRSGERIDTFDSIRIRKDGSRIAVSLTISPIKDSTGRVIGASKIARDISERERHEQALIEADRRRTEFLAILAHELRNPLAPISTGLEVLSRSTDPVQQAEVRDMMQRQTSQLVTLVDDLMDVSRISQGRMEVRKVRVDLADVIKTAVETSQPGVSRLRHTLSVKGPREPIELDADPVRLAQAISNLLHNAAKFTPEGGLIELTVERSGAEAEISVKDNGIGIPQGAQDNIFEMFAQGGHPLEKSNAGLGIGLTLVKKLVEMHGGSVSVQSQGSGQGSEFRIRLPLPTDLTRPGAPAAAAAAIEGTRRVLVVDDNKAAAEMLSTLLLMSGHDVRTAHSGIEALDIAGTFQPELALLDLGMPGMNGYETAVRLRSSAGAGLMLVAVTGWGHAEDRRRSREAGFDAHLVKPLRTSDLQKLFAGLKDLPDAPAPVV